MFTNILFCICLGEYGPGIALIAASFTGCNPPLTVAVLTIGVGLNGGIYSGFKVNHLDISPRFAGILMAFTNCLANLAGLLAPLTAGYVIKGKVKHPLHNYFTHFLFFPPIKEISWCYALIFAISTIKILYYFIKLYNTI